MKLRYVAASLSMFCFVGLALWAYNKVVVQGDTSMTVPLIKAPDGPYKSIPEDPGGMDIDHQDAAIYDMLDRNRKQSDEPIFLNQQSAQSDDDADAPLVQKGFVLGPTLPKTEEEPKVERLFDERSELVEQAKKNIEQAESTDIKAENTSEDIRNVESLAAEDDTDIAPEEVDAGIIIADPKSMDDHVKAPAPIAKPKTSKVIQENTTSTATNAKPNFNDVLGQVLSDDAQSAPSVSDVTQSDAALEGMEELHSYVTRRKPATGRTGRVINEDTSFRDVDLSPSSTSSPTLPIATNSFFIQLASLPSADAAQREWAVLQNRYPDILGRMTVRYVDIDLGGDRGIFTRVQAGPYSESDARDTCAKLAQAGKDSGCIVVSR